MICREGEGEEERNGLYTILFGANARVWNATMEIWVVGQRPKFCKIPKGKREKEGEAHRAKASKQVRSLQDNSKGTTLALRL